MEDLRSNIGMAKLNTTAAIKLVVLTLLQNPEVGRRFPYPKKLRRKPYANYYEAYLDEPVGWTGQELMELVNLIIPTQTWRCQPDMMYNNVLASLDRHELVVTYRETPVRKGYNTVWYRLNDNPEGDPSRPIHRMIEQDKSALAPQLQDAYRFLKAIDDFVYGGKLLKQQG